MNKLPLIRSRWKRVFLGFYLSWLIFLGKFQSSRARVHWVGSQVRSRRLERVLGILLLCGAIIILEPREYILWSIWWGGLASMFVIWQSVRILIPEKESNWVRNK